VKLFTAMERGGPIAANYLGNAATGVIWKICAE
jgi:hypothetical protein